MTDKSFDFIIERLTSYSQDAIVKELQRVWNILGKRPFTYSEFKKAGGRVSDVTVGKYFGSWNEGLAAANIPIFRKMYVKDEDLMGEFHRVVLIYQRKPTYIEFKQVSKYSITTYVKRYGSYLRACHRYLDWLSPDVDSKSTYVSECLKKKPRHSAKKTTLTKSLRFDVFLRDNFTCKYCGKHPPNVKLEVDHRIPRAEGGTDEIENLITSCYDCNRGKQTKVLPNLRLKKDAQ